MAMPHTLSAGPLRLSRISPADLDSVVVGVRASVPQIQPWMEWATDDYALPHATDWFALSWNGWNAGTAHEFVIYDDASTTFLGCAGLNRISGHKANLGFWISTPHAGRGYCTVAARRLVRAGFEELGLQRIYLEHMVENAASGRVAEKVGFQLEGRIRNGHRYQGKPTDVMQYGLVDVSEIRDD
ncbi:MAG: GNAT family N-acetyltransferase [Myxococcota bacterium]